MNRRNFAVAVGATPTLSGCFWDKHFDLTWKEDVQLHDGRVIVVKLKYTYERLRPGFTQYGGQTILRDTTLTFDAGGPVGLKTQLLKGGFPLILEQQEGAWYLVFSWASRWSRQLLGGQDWGEDQNGHNQHVAILEGVEFKTISICSLPAHINQPNILLVHDPVEEISGFHNTHVTLRQKLEYLALHPLSVGYVRIEMPSSNSSNACKPSINRNQGERK